MSGIEIYLTRFCPYCAAAKALLKRKGFEFREIDIAANCERRDEMLARSNGKVTVPQIFVGNLHIGGLDELRHLERSGKLAELGTRRSEGSNWTPSGIKLAAD